MSHSHYENCSCLSASRFGLSPWRVSCTGRRSGLCRPPGRRTICCPHRGPQRGTEGFSWELPAEAPLGDTQDIDGCLSLLYWVKFPYIDNQLITPTDDHFLTSCLQLCLPLCHLTLLSLCFLPTLNQRGQNTTTDLMTAFTSQAETDKHVI